MGKTEELSKVESISASGLRWLGDEILPDVAGYCYKGTVFVCTDKDDKPIYFFGMTDDGMIRSLWKDPRYKFDDALRLKMGKMMIEAIELGYLVPESGYLYGFVKPDNVEGNAWASDEGIAECEEVEVDGAKWNRWRTAVVDFLKHWKSQYELFMDNRQEFNRRKAMRSRM